MFLGRPYFFSFVSIMKYKYMASIRDMFTLGRPIDQSWRNTPGGLYVGAVKAVPLVT